MKRLVLGLLFAALAARADVIYSFRASWPVNEINGQLIYATALAEEEYSAYLPAGQLLGGGGGGWPGVDEPWMFWLQGATFNATAANGVAGVEAAFEVATLIYQDGQYIGWGPAEGLLGAFFPGATLDESGTWTITESVPGYSNDVTATLTIADPLAVPEPGMAGLWVVGIGLVALALRNQGALSRLR